MSKQKKLESPGKERFVAMTLEMLDEGVGARELNLRTIARRLGCAHTNAYNYFASLEDLLWWSLREALERMVNGGSLPDSDESRRYLSVPRDPLRAYIDFAMNHPEWYRLVWMVPLNGPPPPEVLAYLPVPGRMLVEWLEDYLGRKAGASVVQGANTTAGREGEVEACARILHRYIHGELAILTTGRLLDPVDQFRRKLVENTDRLFRQLFGVPWTVEQNSFSMEGENES
jgi:AcrR family transcriptional regulator